MAPTHFSRNSNTNSTWNECTSFVFRLLLSYQRESDWLLLCGVSFECHAGGWDQELVLQWARLPSTRSNNQYMHLLAVRN